ncbi:MAG TPA: hypothetical protein V6C72_11215, partial [Chroococcales cyanobacterium]
GCIVINNGENLAVCMVYIFGGRIIGVYSFKRGWIEPSYEAALKHLLSTKGSSVMASGLFAENLQEVQALTFSLTGLADRQQNVVPRRDNSVTPRQLRAETSWLVHGRAAIDMSAAGSASAGIAGNSGYMRSSLRRLG